MDSGPHAHPRRSAGVPPAEIGGYEIVAQLGRGGMGVVYRARDPVTGAGVAVKTVLWAGEGALTAIRREILALSAIRHPGVVEVLAAGVHEGKPWYAMELIVGESLRQKFAQMWQPVAGAQTTIDGNIGSNDPTRFTGLEVTTAGTAAAGAVQSVLGAVRRRHTSEEHTPFPIGSQAGSALAVPDQLRDLLELVVAMCEPLAHVHAAGIVHRDLTPDNVIVRQGGGPVLVDFGLASSFRRGGREALTVGGTIVGTTHYMAPEQIRGELVDARADLYSLGCILYEALTGRPPFLGASPSGVLAMHLYEPPVPPSARETSVPLWLNSLVLGLLAKDPRARIGYASDVAAVVQRALGGGGPVPKLELDAAHYVYRPRLIGRGGEMQRFDSVLGRLRERHGGVVLVRGESGVGKTRLAVELATRGSAEGMRVVVAECPPVVGDERAQSRAAPLAPLKPLLQAIADRCLDQGDGERERLLGERGRVLATYEPAIARLPGVLDSPAPPALTVEGTRSRLYQYLRETLEAFTDTGPVILLVDDLQWADELTLRFLVSLRGPTFDSRPLLVLATQRAEMPHPLLDELIALPSTEVIELPRLDEAGIHAMVSDMLALPDLPPALVSTLVTPSAGVPFHAGEYLRAAVEDGILVRRPGGPWALTGDRAGVLPGSIAELVRHRLDRLGPTGRTLAALAAVVGREFDAELLAELTSLPAAEVDDTLRDLVRRHIFEEAAGGKLRFGHDKIREVAYHGLDADDRRRAHRDAARALEHRVTTAEPSHDLYPVLAHHYSMADEPARAIEFLEKAGERALEVGGYQDAIDFLRRALTLTERGAAPVARARRGRWKRWLGEASWGLGDIDGCGVWFSAALDDLDRPLPTSRVGWLADVGRRAAGQVARIALGRPAPAGDTEAGESALAVARMTYHYFHRGENLPMVASTLRAVDLADRAQTGARVAHTYNQVGYVAGMFGLGRVAEHYFAAAEQRATASDDAANLGVSLYLQAIHWYCTGACGRALRLAEDSVDRLRRIGHTHELEVAISTLAHIEHSLGAYAEALAHCHELYESARARANGMHEAWGAYTIAREHLALGNLDDARLQLDHAHALAVAAGDRASLVLMGGLRALTEVRSHGRAGAAALDAWLGLVRGTMPIVYTFGHGYAAAAEAALRLLDAAPGDAAMRERARDAVAQLWRYALVFPIGRTTAMVLEAWSQRLVGRRRIARRLATAALGRARAGTLPYEEALALRELAALDPLSSEDHAAAAAAVMERIGRQE